MSNVSTRAVVNSSPWEPSRRSSSLAETTSGIGQHLSRLHKKAQQHDGRQSVMSECSNNMAAATSDPSSSSLSGYGGRRASDPVRVLDRNFGVGGQMSRHRSGSYSGQQPSVPTATGPASGGGIPANPANPAYQVIISSSRTFWGPVGGLNYG